MILYKEIGVRDSNVIIIRVTNSPGMSGTVPESEVCVPRPGQKQSGTIKCPGIGSAVLIMVKELHLA